MSRTAWVAIAVSKEATLAPDCSHRSLAFELREANVENLLMEKS